jgi:hypothetical protein
LEQDFFVITEIMKIFAMASGLQINVAKTEIFHLNYEATNLSHITSSSMIILNFPCKYLGLPLHFKKSSKQMMQPVIQKIIDRLLGWKRNFLSYPGRELLVKIVLSAMHTFFLTVHKIHKWAFARIDRFRRSFLWKDTNHDRIRGGHSLVN